MSLTAGMEVFLARRAAAFAEGKAVIDAAAVVHRGAVWSLSAPARHGDVMRLPGWLYPFDGLIGDGGPEAQGFMARRREPVPLTASDGRVWFHLFYESVTAGRGGRLLDMRVVFPRAGERFAAVEHAWFVDRETAAKIAVEAGQIEAPRWGPELFSEDLW